MSFLDRRNAGVLLAEKLERYKGGEGVVYAIPRGGVVVAEPVALALSLPMDLIITRKIGHPANAEYAICVVAEDGQRWCNEVEIAGVSPEWLREQTKKAISEAKRRREVYGGGRKRAEVEGKTAFLVDDGVATGMTFLAAAKELAHLKPKRIVAALPVMPLEFKEKLEKIVDEIICLKVEADFLGAVGAYYREFPQVSDDEVKAILEKRA